MLRELFSKKQPAKPKQLITPQEYSSVNINQSVSEQRSNSNTRIYGERKKPLFPNTIPNLTTAQSTKSSNAQRTGNVTQMSNTQKTNLAITMDGNQFAPAMMNTNGTLNTINDKISSSNINQKSVNNNTTTIENNEYNFESIPEKIQTAPSEINKSRTSYSSNNRPRTGRSGKNLNQTATSIPYEDKLNILQGYISNLQTKNNDKKAILDKAEMKKRKLQMNVDVLQANLRSIYRVKKDHYKANREILKENDRLNSMGVKAVEESNFIMKELPSLREEIDFMKYQMDNLKEATQVYRNEFIGIDREMLGLKDEIKKRNTANTLMLKEKEKLQNDIIAIEKKKGYLQDKINAIEKSNIEFMNSVGLLVQENEKTYNENFSKIL